MANHIRAWIHIASYLTLLYAMEDELDAQVLYSPNLTVQFLTTTRPHPLPDNNISSSLAVLQVQEAQ